MVVLLVPCILDLALGPAAFHCPDRLRHRERESSAVCLRAGTIPTARQSVGHCGGNLKPRSLPQSDVLTQAIVGIDG